MSKNILTLLLSFVVAVNPVLTYSNESHTGMSLSDYLKEVKEFELDKGNLADLIVLLEEFKYFLEEKDHQSLFKIKINELKTEVKILEKTCKESSSLEKIRLSHEAFIKNYGGRKTTFWEYLYDKTYDFLTNPYLLMAAGFLGVIFATLFYQSYSAQFAYYRENRFIETDKIHVDAQGKIFIDGKISNKKQISRIFLTGKKITDISVLEEFTNLTELVLSDNFITDITPIAKLKNLEVLKLSRNKVNKLKPLKNLQNLMILDLSQNKITDLSSLEKIKSLVELNLSSNPIKEVSFLSLSKLTNLQMLKLGFNKMTDRYLKKIFKNLTGLTHLYLVQNKIVDISGLKDLKNLEVLDLGLNDIKKMTALNQLEKLKELYLGNNDISDIPPLKKLKNLEKIDLSTNSIKSMVPLASLPEITHVNLRSNKLKSISNLSLLKGFKKLTHINLSWNHLVDISPIMKLKSLREINLEQCPIIEQYDLQTLKKKFTNKNIRIIQ